MRRGFSRAANHACIWALTVFWGWNFRYSKGIASMSELNPIWKKI